MGDSNLAKTLPMTVGSPFVASSEHVPPTNDSHMAAKTCHDQHFRPSLGRTGTIQFVDARRVFATVEVVQDADDGAFLGAPTNQHPDGGTVQGRSRVARP